MADFPAIEPSFSVTKKSEPVVKVVSFADGFEHPNIESHVELRPKKLVNGELPFRINTSVVFLSSKIQNGFQLKLSY